MQNDFANDIPLELAQRAHSGTSFVPERRATSEREGYASTLSSDYANLEKLATTDDKRATLAEEFPRYRAGYRARYLAHLGSRARCLSAMITGPSNFPTARNAKRNDHADKKTKELIDYRVRALAAIHKALCPELAPIMAGDSDATTRLQAQIDKATKLQAQMTACNAAIRKHKRADEAAQIAALVALGLTDKQATGLLQPDSYGNIGFARYELTNNGANIRRMQTRLEVISRNQATAPTWIQGERARLEDCPPDNRVRLFYPGKPDEATRSRLKSSGFRWTPSLGCWQAYRNDRALDIARREAG